MNYKNKLFTTKRKAFTLIELLIVIAIIGILFIVLVSKVDFATDKAKATGVQTDFRSFQVALETVARENAGFNTFGYDSGDANGNRIRDSYDKGDANKNGIQDAGEVFVGSKVYTETWTGIYTLVKPGTNVYDVEVLAELEFAINKHLDPKLHITIDENGIITMANHATDPWGNEYHGRYLSNAANDNLDRGVIIMYSNGANTVNGSADGIAEGLVNITTPDFNVNGKDDYALAVMYTKVNGYGEIQSITKGFSNNKQFNNADHVLVTPVDEVPEVQVPTGLPIPDTDDAGANTNEALLGMAPGVYDENNNLLVDWEQLVKPVSEGGYGLDPSRNYTWGETTSHSNHINAVMSSIGNVYRVVIPGDVVLGEYSFAHTSLKSIIVKDGLVETPSSVFSENRSLIEIVLPNSITKMGYRTIGYCTSLTYFDFPDNLTEVGDQVCCGCESLKEVSWPTNVQTINSYAFSRAGFITLELPDTVVNIGESAFSVCQNLVHIKLPKNLETIPKNMFSSALSLRSVVWPENIKVIGEMAFFGTDFTSLVIPETVEQINSAAFSQNYRMVEVVNKSNLPSTSSALQFQTWKWGVNVIEDESQSRVFTQGDWVFWSNPSGQLYLIAYQGTDEVVTLPNYNNMQYILNEHVFAFNNTVKHIIFCEYAVSVTGQFCYSVSKLESITIPCNTIVNSIYSYPSKFYSTNNLTSIYVPASLVDTYKTGNFWSLYETIIKPI